MSAALSRALIRSIRVRIARGCSSRSIAATEGLHQTTVSKIARDPTLPGPTTEGRRRGERCTQAVLTAEQVREIRSLYAEGGLSTSSLAVDYGVARTTIRKAISRQSWAHVEDE